MEYLFNKALKYQTACKDADATRGSNFSSVYGIRDKFPLSYYYDTEERSFEGQMFSTPKESIEMLKQIYGNYMRLPPKNQQYPTHHLLELKLPKDKFI